MLVWLAAPEAIQVGQRAGVPNSRISRRVGDLRRKNRPHRREHLRVSSRRRRNRLATRRKRGTRILPRLHAVSNCLQQIRIRQRQTNRDRYFIQLPDPRLLLHGKCHVRHERSPLHLSILVGQERQLDIVLVRAERIVLHP